MSTKSVKPVLQKAVILSGALSVAALFVAMTGPSFGGAAAAQDAEYADDPSAEICVTRERGPGATVTVIVQARAAQSMLRQGYSVVPCGEAFPSVADRAAWRDEICTMASQDDEVMQSQLERIYGERAAVLCAMAEVIVGPWDRGYGRGQ